MFFFKAFGDNGCGAYYAVIGDMDAFEEDGTIPDPHVVPDHHIHGWIGTVSLPIEDGVGIPGSNHHIGRAKTICAEFDGGSLDTGQMDRSVQAGVFANHNLVIVVFNPQLRELRTDTFVKIDFIL